MNVLTTIRRALGFPTAATMPLDGWENWFVSRMTTSGEPVGPMEALAHAPAWQAVNIIAGDLGQLPFRIVRRDGDQQVEAIDHANEWLLNHEPNAVQTPALWKETLMIFALLWGNGCAAIFRDPAGRIEQLVPLLPWRLRAVHDPSSTLGQGYLLIYTTTQGREIGLMPADVVHIRGLAIDGNWGRSAIEVARDTFGLGIAARQHASTVFRNGGLPSGILKTPYEDIDNAARATLRKEWEKVHAGRDNSYKIGILTAGMEYEPLAMSNADAQLMELMRLDREQVASLFNLPAFKLNALENAAVRANVAESNRAYYATTLSRWAKRFSEELQRKLFTRDERLAYRVEMDAEALTAGSPDDRMRRAVLGVRGKVITRNEARRIVGMNPVPGGDKFENPATSGDGGRSIPVE